MLAFCSWGGKSRSSHLTSAACLTRCLPLLNFICMMIFHCFSSSRQALAGATVAADLPPTRLGLGCERALASLARSDLAWRDQMIRRFTSKRRSTQRAKSLAPERVQRWRLTKTCHHAQHDELGDAGGQVPYKGCAAASRLDVRDCVDNWSEVCPGRRSVLLVLLVPLQLVLHPNLGVKLVEPAHVAVVPLHCQP